MLILPFGSQILSFLTKMWGNTAASRPLVAASGVWSVPAVFQHALLIQPTNSEFYHNLISKPATSQFRNPCERLDYQESLWIHLTVPSSSWFPLSCGNGSALLFLYQRPETSQSAGLQGHSGLKVIFSSKQWCVSKVCHGFDDTTTFSHNKE